MVPSEQIVTSQSLVPDLAQSDALTSSRITPVQAPQNCTFEEMGTVNGNTLQAILDSPHGEKVRKAIEESLIHDMIRSSKRHNDHLIKAMKEARREQSP